MISLYFPIPQIRQELDLDSDDSLCIYQAPAPDLVRQLDGVMEVTDSAYVPYPLSHMVALEAYLNEPYGTLSGERDAEGTHVTEYPLDRPSPGGE